jgi:hypothetical protein
MANDLSASKFVGYAVEKPSGKDALGSGKLVGYAVEKASGNDRTGAGKLAAYTVLSSGVVLAWRHSAELHVQTGAALAASTPLASAPTFAFGATADLSAGGSQSTDDNILALIPLVL